MEGGGGRGRREQAKEVDGKGEEGERGSDKR